MTNYRGHIDLADRWSEGPDEFRQALHAAIESDGHHIVVEAAVELSRRLKGINRYEKAGQ